MKRPAKCKVSAFGSIAALLTCAVPAVAQDGAAVPPGWHVRHVRVVGGRAATVRHERGLTVRRRFAPPPATDGDIFVEGGTIYGDIAAFVPEPKIDSGVQYPYGLDGIGGYGSDLGFGAGQDDVVYDRGALDRAALLGATIR